MSEETPPRPLADRDYIFGVLAVRMAMVRAADLAVFVRDWPGEKDFGRALVAGGLIAEGSRELVESVIAFHLAGHGNDAGAVLAGLGGEAAAAECFGGVLAGNEPAGTLAYSDTEPDSTLISEDAPWPGPQTGPLPLGPLATRGGAWEGLDDSDRITAEAPDRYTLREEKGRGGIGRVLIAFDEHLGREVAVKELIDDPSSLSQSSGPHPTPSTASSPATARFIREARITGQLQHPGIVPLYELGRRGDGSTYYTMKLVRGRTLAAAIRECDSLSARLRLLPHFHELCQAMAYAHAKGVIHRDLKPANIMIGEFGETVLLDWGLAKVKGAKDIREHDIERGLELIRQASTDQTLPGRPLGTPAYMSPEQALGRVDDIDETSDVWALGVILYEFLAGRPPFVGASALEVVEKVVTETPLPVSAFEPEAPAELAAVAEKCLARNRNDRYPDAGGVAEDISRYLAGDTVSVHNYSTAARLEKWIVRRWQTIAVAAAIAILTIAAGAMIRSSNKQRLTENLLIGDRTLAEGNYRYAAVIYAGVLRDRPDLATWSKFLCARAKLIRPASLGGWTNPELVSGFKAHNGAVTTLSFLDFERFLTASQPQTDTILNYEHLVPAEIFRWRGDSKVVVWNLADKTTVRSYAAAPGEMIFIGPNGRLVLFAKNTGPNITRLIAVEALTGRELDGATVTPGADVAYAAVDDGRTLADLALPRSLRLFLIQPFPCKLLTIRPGALYDNWPGGEEKYPGNDLKTARFSRQGTLWLLHENAALDVFHRGGQEERSIELGHKTPYLLAAGDDRAALAWCADYGLLEGGFLCRDSRVEVVGLEAAETVRQVLQTRDQIVAMEFDSTGRYLALARLDHVIQVLEPASARIVMEVGSREGADEVPTSLAFSPEGDHLLYGDASGVVRVLPFEPGAGLDGLDRLLADTQTGTPESFTRVIEKYQNQQMIARLERAGKSRGLAVETLLFKLYDWFGRGRGYFLVAVIYLIMLAGYLVYSRTTALIVTRIEGPAQESFTCRLKQHGIFYLLTAVIAILAAASPLYLWQRALGLARLVNNDQGILVAWTLVVFAAAAALVFIMRGPALKVQLHPGRIILRRFAWVETLDLSRVRQVEFYSRPTGQSLGERRKTRNFAGGNEPNIIITGDFGRSWLLAMEKPIRFQQALTAAMAQAGPAKPFVNTLLLLNFLAMVIGIIAASAAFNLYLLTVSYYSPFGWFLPW